MSLNIVEQYLAGLRLCLPEEDREALSHTRGALPEEVELLKKRFPACPEALIQLLSQINGTYWEKYGDKEVSVLMLGSDLTGYPYYLKSVRQILEQNDSHYSIREIYEDYFDDDPELLGPGIDPDVKISDRLCFSDCMNNGGTSQLYVDFNPGSGGVSGQIVRYLHDPDSYAVIAESFDAYLQKLMDDDYAFLTDDEA